MNEEQYSSSFDDYSEGWDTPPAEAAGQETSQPEQAQSTAVDPAQYVSREDYDQVRNELSGLNQTVGKLKEVFGPPQQQQANPQDQPLVDFIDSYLSERGYMTAAQVNEQRDYESVESVATESGFNNLNHAWSHYGSMIEAATASGHKQAEVAQILQKVEEANLAGNPSINGGRKNYQALSQALKAAKSAFGDYKNPFQQTPAPMNNGEGFSNQSNTQSRQNMSADEIANSWLNAKTPEEAEHYGRLLGNFRI